MLNIRDPSIIAYNLAFVQENKENQADVLNSESEENNCLKVYLRIKPTEGENFEALYEIVDAKSLVSKQPRDNVNRNGTSINNKFSFSKIFPPTSCQKEMFNEIVKPKILNLINGRNSTLMTYGVSGSGKTYTIVGTPEQPGILPRALEFLFQTLPNVSKTPKIKPLQNGTVIQLDAKELNKDVVIKENILINHADQTHVRTYCTMKNRLSDENSFAIVENPDDVTLAVWVSFAEIYKEHIYDLFESNSKLTRQKLKISQINKDQVFIKNLTMIHVSSGLEAYQLLQYGLQKLNKASTNMNADSSRSHSIFKVMLAQLRTNRDGEDEYHVSHFNFCDLAGAERSKKTLNVGMRQVESNSINTSLLVLGRCIKGVRDAQKNSDFKLIPFRESKLTQLFQRALSGHEDIDMVVNINPSRNVFEETQHVLSFSAIAKEIVISKTKSNEAYKREQRYAVLQREESVKVEKSQKMQELRDQIENYQALIEEEEINQYTDIADMKEEYENYYKKKIEDDAKKFEEEYGLEELRVKREIREKLRETKKRILCDSEFRDYMSSESDDSEDDELTCRNYRNIYKKPRLADAEASTIIILSSDDEESTDCWKIKYEQQIQEIEEHHKTMKALKDKIVELNKQKEFLQKKIKEQRNLPDEDKSVLRE